MARYAAVAEEIFDDPRVGATIGLFGTEHEAFDFLGEAAFDGYQADGVHDLDTCENIGVHVSTPIVTRAAQQRVTTNPIVE